MARRLSILNTEPRRLPGPETLHELVALQRDGDNIAIDYTAEDGTNNRITYNELHARSSALAQRILELRTTSTGQQRSRFIVPLYMKQSPHLYISQLAVLRAGGGFCPIALDAPEGRMRFVLQDIEAEVLLTTSDLRTGLPALEGIKVVPVDELSLDKKASPSTVEVAASDAAYVM